MKHYKIIHFLFLLAAFFSCTEDAVVTDDDNILNYEVPFEPIISDYLVGAQYTRFVRRNNVPEEPSIGIYNGNVADPLVYEQHVNQANTAGIDFFIFQFRSANNSNLKISVSPGMTFLLNLALSIFGTCIIDSYLNSVINSVLT